jgi:hypothetical protein
MVAPTDPTDATPDHRPRIHQGIIYGFVLVLGIVCMFAPQPGLFAQPMPQLAPPTTMKEGITFNHGIVISTLLMVQLPLGRYTYESAAKLDISNIAPTAYVNISWPASNINDCHGGQWHVHSNGNYSYNERHGLKLDYYSVITFRSIHPLSLPELNGFTKCNNYHANRLYGIHHDNHGIKYMLTDDTYKFLRHVTEPQFHIGSSPWKVISQDDRRWYQDGSMILKTLLQVKMETGGYVLFTLLVQGILNKDGSADIVPFG